MDRRRVGFAIAVAALVLAVSAALVEGVLRVYAGVAETSLARALREDPYDVLVEPHGEVGYRPLPDHAFPYENGTTARTNGMGFRGPEVTVPKPPGTYRIVLLGGSTSFGWGVDDDGTITRHMADLLEERYPDRVFDVVNLAFDGYDSYQLLERLRSDGPRLEPDAVIVNTGINDVSHAWLRDIQDGDRRNLLYRNTLDRLRLERARGGPTLWTRTKHWLFAARVPGWLRGELGVAGAGRAVSARRPTPHWDVLDYFERNLGRLVAEADRAGAAVVLFSTPPSSLRTRYEPTDPPMRHYWVVDAETTQVYRDSLDARMRVVVAGEARPGVSLAYVPHEELPPSVFLDDAHLTSEGNRIVAEDFVAALEPWLVEPGS